MSHLTGLLQGSGQALLSSSSTPAHDLGEKMVIGPRTFRYVQAGTPALVAGNVIQAPAQVTAHQQLVPTANQAIGAMQLTLTLGAAAAAENLYAGGWAIVDTTPGLGQVCRISGHAAVLSAGVITVNLDRSDALWVAITAAASRIGLQANPYKGVIQSPITTLTGSVIGVAVYPIAAAEYGWIQTSGPAGVLVAGTPGVGLAVVVPGTVAGCVVVDGAAAATKVVGSMMVTGVDGKVQAVWLDLE